MRIERIRAVTVGTGADVMVRSNYVFVVLETDACDAEAEVEALGGERVDGGGGVVRPIDVDHLGGGLLGIRIHHRCLPLPLQIERLVPEGSGDGRALGVFSARPPAPR